MHYGGQYILYTYKINFYNSNSCIIIKQVNIMVKLCFRGNRGMGMRAWGWCREVRVWGRMYGGGRGRDHEVLRVSARGRTGKCMRVRFRVRMSEPKGRRVRTWSHEGDDVRGAREWGLEGEYMMVRAWWVGHLRGRGEARYKEDKSDGKGKGQGARDKGHGWGQWWGTG